MRDRERLCPLKTNTGEKDSTILQAIFILAVKFCYPHRRGSSCLSSFRQKHGQRTKANLVSLAEGSMSLLRNKKRVCNDSRLLISLLSQSQAVRPLQVPYLIEMNGKALHYTFDDGSPHSDPLS